MRNVIGNKSKLKKIYKNVLQEMKWKFRFKIKQDESETVTFVAEERIIKNH